MAQFLVISPAGETLTREKREADSSEQAATEYAHRYGVRAGTQLAVTAPAGVTDFYEVEGGTSVRVLEG